ncbi:MAG TPA: hypothetical protein VN192_06325 [Flavobacterium sp.]|nr:hypothetical protein [Flavobacterium sp.]
MVKSLKLESKSKTSKDYTRVLLFLIFFLASFVTNAQCAMCRAAIESEGNAKSAEAINDGIVYLMAIPYLLVAIIGYYVYRMYKSKKG